jgi:hypothetical protein
MSGDAQNAKTPPTIVFHNDRLAELACAPFGAETVDALEALLRSQGTFKFRTRRKTGLFPAAAVSRGTGYTKRKLKPSQRTACFVDQLPQRDAVGDEGQEAQWCIFDPIVSAIYGRRYQQDRRRADLAQQIFYFQRSLGQITGHDSPFGPFQFPELYYVEDGRWVPSDATPLLWAQANLMVALKLLRDSLADPAAAGQPAAAR